MPNPVQVFNLADIDGEARSAIMGVVKGLGGYSESLPSPSPEVRGGVSLNMEFAIKRGPEAEQGTMPWLAIAMVALSKLNGSSRDAVYEQALGGDYPKTIKAVVENEVETVRARMRITNGKRPGNITGTISGQARFS